MTFNDTIKINFRNIILVCGNDYYDRSLFIKNKICKDVINIVDNIFVVASKNTEKYYKNITNKISALSDIKTYFNSIELPSQGDSANYKTIIIIDDENIKFNSKNRDDNAVMYELVYNARIYGMICVFTTDETMFVPPEVRSNFDWIVISKYYNENMLNKYYDYYFSTLPNFEKKYFEIYIKKLNKNEFLVLQHKKPYGENYCIFGLTVGSK